jgi:hypothetical protein
VQATSHQLSCGAPLRLFTDGRNVCTDARATAAARRVPRRIALIAALLFLTPAVASAGRLDLAWDPSPDTSVTGYVVYYGTAAGSYTQSVDVGNRTTYPLEGVIDGITYYLVVKAYNASGDFSAPSNEVRRSGVFSDDPLTAGVHVMRLTHLTELRARIDALRAARNLPATPWTAVVAGVSVIRAGDIGEMRTALHAVYLAAGRTPPLYTDPVLTPAWTRLKAAHIRELRAAVVALE